MFPSNLENIPLPAEFPLPFLGTNTFNEFIFRFKYFVFFFFVPINLFYIILYYLVCVFV